MTEPIAGKIGVANLGQVVTQINQITESPPVARVYSDPLPDLRFFQGRVGEQATLAGWLRDPTLAVVGLQGQRGIG